MSCYILLTVVGLLVVNADRTEQGNLLQKNTVNINGEADGVVTLHLGPFGTPPTLKCKSDKPTTVGVQCKPANQFPNPLPSNQGVKSLALAGYAGMEITSSNPDAKCQYELTTIDLTAFLTGGSQVTGIMCDNGNQPPTGVGGGGPGASSSGVGGGGPGASSSGVGAGGPGVSSSAGAMYSSSAGVVPSSSAPAVSSSAQTYSSSAAAGSSATPVYSSSAQAAMSSSAQTYSSSAETSYSSSAETSYSSSATEVMPSSSGSTVMSSSGSSGGTCNSNCNWECVPCQNQQGQLIATLVKTGFYVFVSIEQVLQAVLGSPCDIIAGLNRTIHWAEEFAMDCKTQSQNTVNVVSKDTSTQGDSNQRHRDCGEDMGHFYDVDLVNLQAEFETTLEFTFTEEMLTSKGFCGTCGNHLRWAFFDELTSMWKFPEEASEVDENKKECTQKATNSPAQNMPKSWAVVYATNVNNGTTGSSGGGGGTGGTGGGTGSQSGAGSSGLGGTGGPGCQDGCTDQSAADARLMSMPIVGVLGLLALYLVR